MKRWATAPMRLVEIEEIEEIEDVEVEDPDNPDDLFDQTDLEDDGELDIPPEIGPTDDFILDEDPEDPFEIP